MKELYLNILMTTHDIHDWNSCPLNTNNYLFHASWQFWSPNYMNHALNHRAHHIQERCLWWQKGWVAYLLGGNRLLELASHHCLPLCALLAVELMSVLFSWLPSHTAAYDWWLMHWLCCGWRNSKISCSLSCFLAVRSKLEMEGFGCLNESCWSCWRVMWVAYALLVQWRWSLVFYGVCFTTISVVMEDD